MKMSGDGDHARRQDECLKGTSAPYDVYDGFEVQSLRCSEVHRTVVLYVLI